jgi:molybdopterin synthase catalytic subunit
MNRVSHFFLTEKAIDIADWSAKVRNAAAGAVVTFEGRVRNHNDGHRVSSLEYQAYPSLALRVGEHILEDVCNQHGLLSALAIHRIGSLQIGDCAVWIAVSAEHRRAAFAAAEAIMERLKYELPVWKKETYENGSVEWVGPDQHHPLTGEPDSRTPAWKANLEAIWISSGNDFRGRHGMARAEHGILSVDFVECVAGKGLRGDRYFGYKTDFKGQVTFFDAAVVDELRHIFNAPDLSSAVLRRNLIVRGVRLKDWIGKRFVFQGVEFEGSEECKPCYWMDEAVAKGAEEFLTREARGGLRARILSSGVLKVQ